MPSIEHLELMPEPDEPRLLTTVDPSAPGYPGEAYGLTDEEARQLRWPLGPIKEALWPWGAVFFSIGTLLLLVSWPFIDAYLTPVLPDSEWAYEDTGIRRLQSTGLSGEGVDVCIVDTGADISHRDLEGASLVGFRDFYEENNQEVRDVGDEYHGTMMTGLLVANGTFTGAAPGVSLSIALALGPEGSSGQQDRVALAIRWCRITQEVDIISLSLGANPGNGMGTDSETVAAVNEALQAGIFVVAAAGNTGLEESISDVSVPANIPGVIAVGAVFRSGVSWPDSASGSVTDPYGGDNRTFPNQKPEISAPGVNIFSTATTDLTPPYAYSSGTSDSTVFVTGALSLILELYGEDLAGDDGIISQEDMELVKRALANSAASGGEGGAGHDNRLGYGELDAFEWASQVAFELNLN